jgi:hypothetical protein
VLPPVNELLPYIQIATGAAVLVGFLFTYLSFRRTGKSEQVKLVEKIKDSLTTLDKEIQEIEDGDENALSAWDSRRFNTWEWYSSLVNEKQITDKNIKEYFRKGVINDYEEVFLKYASKKTIDDPNQYPEFKKLYRRLTGKQVS